MKIAGCCFCLRKLLLFVVIILQSTPSAICLAGNNSNKRHKPLAKRSTKDALIIEQGLKERGFSYVIGSDESGRGCIAGGLITASCCILEAATESIIQGVDDSKRLTKESRDRIHQEILSKPDIFVWSVATKSSQEIDDITLEQATQDCFQESIDDVIQQLRQRVDFNPKNVEHTSIYSIIDGNKSPNLNPITSRAWKRGDEMVYSVALASIIARCHHEKIITGLAAEFPLYQFDKNGCYASRQHTEALHQHGPSPVHRQSCKPVKGR